MAKRVLGILKHVMDHTMEYLKAEAFTYLGLMDTSRYNGD
jgi:hypothetical protein